MQQKVIKSPVLFQSAEEIWARYELVCAEEGMIFIEILLLESKKYFLDPENYITLIGERRSSPGQNFQDRTCKIHFLSLAQLFFSFLWRGKSNIKIKKKKVVEELRSGNSYHPKRASEDVANDKLPTDRTCAFVHRKSTKNFWVDLPGINHQLHSSIFFQQGS